MSPTPLNLTAELYAYVVAHGGMQDPDARDLIEETRLALPAQAEMQIAPDQAAFMTFLARTIGARYAVEVGTFTGFSALALARGLVDGGKLICFDISEEYTSIARRYWDRAGVADKVELRIGPAAERLAELPDKAEIDIAFIDADKGGYPVYWAEIVPRLRPGGLVLVDNVLRGGNVLAPGNDGDVAIAKFNEVVRADDRVEAVMLPIADGLTVARKL
jgi:caffeoyl-CoA O-methyltransferase